MLPAKSKLSTQKCLKISQSKLQLHLGSKIPLAKREPKAITGKARKLPAQNVRAHRVITQHVISRSDPEPNAAGPTVVVSFRIRVLACLSRLSIAPANRAMRTDRFAIHVERRGSGVAAQCSRIIYADDVETIPCSYVRCTHVRRSK